MKNKATLTLMELAVMILVFALGAALCLQAFAWADTGSLDNRDRDLALTHAQNGAELIKHYGGDLSRAAQTYGGTVTGECWQFTTGEGFLLEAACREGTPLVKEFTLTVKSAAGELLAQLPVAVQEVDREA